MPKTKIIANYYQQFPADYSLEVPGEGYGGWKRAEIDLDIDGTALVVMHAWTPFRPVTHGMARTNLRRDSSHERTTTGSKLRSRSCPAG